VEISKGNKNKRRKKDRKGVEIASSIGKKKRDKQGKSDDGEKVFCLQKFWAYCLLL